MEAIAIGCTSKIGVLKVDDSKKCTYFAAFNNLCRFDYETHRQTLTPAPSPITTISLCQRFCFVGCQDGSCSLLPLDFDSGHRHKWIHFEHSVSFSAGMNDVIAFGTIDGQVYIYNTLADEPRLLCIVKAPRRLTALGLISYMGSTILLSALSDLSITVHDIRNPEPLLILTDHHTNWINQFAVSGNRFLTCGQDKAARIWSFSGAKTDDRSRVKELIETNHKCMISSELVAIDTEAILLGHEDSVLSGVFLSPESVVTCSADRTLIKWLEGEHVWESVMQVGDVNGIGTAGSGDLFDVCQLSDGSLIAHNTHGTVVRWGSDGSAGVLLSGHTLSVEDVMVSGPCIMSCSLDRTTRAWVANESLHMAEVARPQVHGYELKSLAKLSDSVFVSAGDEKVIRIFQCPKSFADRVFRLTGCKISGSLEGGDVSQPVLGLSNKIENDSRRAASDSARPLENELQSSTLFPEIDKLYGHGDEVQCVAVGGDYIASASRSHLAGDSSVRIWSSHYPHQQLFILQNHALTVLRLSFSPSNQQLLSVSRDRKVVIVNAVNGQTACQIDGAHERIIWDACWIDNERFVTASRDKSVKEWSNGGECLNKFAFENAVTAVCCHGERIFAGLEDGQVYRLARGDRSVLCKCNGRINRIVCNDRCIIVASQDHSIRMYPQ